MKILELSEVKHKIKVGNKCKSLEPNVIEDTLFVANGEVVGFYIRSMDEYPSLLATIANKEFRSDSVPKSAMNRTSGEKGHTEKIQQYSTIIGSVQPRPHMGRPEPRISSVHQSTRAKTFVKAMILLGRESLRTIRRVAPDLYEKHIVAVSNSVPEKWRFVDYFSSSISNYNIAANYHRDNGNVVNSVNIIISKRQMATGGNLSIPDYNAVIEQSDNSMIVYPAWRNVHGVTPIVPLRETGYRNSFVFYSLKTFATHG